MAIAAVRFNNLSIPFTPSEDVIEYGKFSPFQPNRKIIPIKKAENGSVSKVTLVSWAWLGVRGIVINYRANLWHPDSGQRNSLGCYRVNKQVYIVEMR